MKSYVAIIATVVLSAMPAWAQRGRPAASSPLSNWTSGIHELHIGTTRGGLTSTKAGKDTMTIIDVSAAYSRLLQPNIQAGGGANFYSSSGGPKNQSYFDIYGMGTYNLSNDLKNAGYLRGAVGMFAVVNDKGDYESKLGFGIGGGKRFPFYDRLTYNPEVRLMKKGDQDPGFEINFLNFSLLF